MTGLAGRSADEVAELLGMVPLVGEGGRFAQTHLDGHGSAIAYLLAAGERSHLHLLPGRDHQLGNDLAEVARLIGP